jgi:RHS repeat-associated protein
MLGRITEIKGEKSQNYTYNHLPQLIFEKNSSTIAHAYDSLDNRVENNNDQLVYNALNQLTSYSKTEYSYDAQGNLLRKVLDGEQTHFESNILSQLTTIEKADKTVVAFSYDPFGRRFSQKHFQGKEKNKTPFSSMRYFYLGYEEIGSLSSFGSIESLKIPGLHGDEISPISIAFEIKGLPYVPLHDIAGNVILLIDPRTRQVDESYEYTAFGPVRIFNWQGQQVKVSPTGNPWQFGEKRFDEKTGLILFGFRIYDGNIGRWISQDPAGFLDGPNAYAYLHNNPLNHLDRLGLNTESNSKNKFEGYFYGEYEVHCFCERHRTCKRGGDIGKTVGLYLPKVTDDDYFEKYYKDYRSHYDLTSEGYPNLPNGLGIGFINGIWNNFSSSKANAK